MTLKELIAKLNSFNCEALEDKEVVHCFVSTNAYGYKEVVKDVVYDAKKQKFMIECENPEQYHWDETALVK